MHPIRKLYLWICRRWGPCGLTISAWAWKRAQETGNKWWRNRIDGAFLFWRGQENHCQTQWQRETRAHHPEYREPAH